MALAAPLGVLAGAGWLVAAWWFRVAPAPPAATFVGRHVCAECHPRQDETWRGSDHDLAMQPADRRTVLGDFGGGTLSQRGVVSTFLWRDGKPFVRTEGPTGRLEDFEVAYTFGVRPLQQYLVALPGGRYQALNIAWDTRSRTAGGQRWLDLYASERPLTVQDVPRGRDVQRLPRPAQPPDGLACQRGLRTLPSAGEVRHGRPPSPPRRIVRVRLRRMSHARADLHGRGPAARSQPARAPSRPHDRDRDAERLHRLPPRPPGEMGGGRRRALGRWPPASGALRAGPRRGTARAAEAQLVGLARDATAPAIARATAVSLLRRRSAASISALERATSDPEPLVRLAAAGAADALGLDVRLSLLGPLLDDPLRAVRIEAARALADAPAERLAPERRAALDRGLADYRRAQEINADRAEAQVNLGIVADRRRESNAAQRAYERAIALDATFVPAYVNLADHYRALDQDVRGEHVLRQGIARVPAAAAALHHALGLLLVRRGRTAEALVALGRAAELAPSSARYAYVHGLALNSTGAGDRALAMLRAAHDRHPGDPDLLVALATLSRDRGARVAARAYARKLLQVAPEPPEARQLSRELDRTGP